MEGCGQVGGTRFLRNMKEEKVLLLEYSSWHSFVLVQEGYLTLIVGYSVKWQENVAEFHTHILHNFIVYQLGY